MYRKRILILMCIFLGIYLLLLGKTAYYQLIQGKDIAWEAVTMRSKEFALKEYPRGEILDRNLLPLTSSSISTAVYGIPQELKRFYHKHSNMSNEQVSPYEDAAKALAGLLTQQDENEILARLENADKQGLEFIKIASDLQTEEIERINAANIEGIAVAPIVKRYRQEGFCAHIIGYTGGGEDSEGLDGMEKVYNGILQDAGSSRNLISVVDARGMAIQGLMFKLRKEEEKGKAAIVLTIDKQIQEIVEETMSNYINKGAVVVMDIDSKEILAMASRPAFNPYEVDNVIENEDAGSALTNRAMSAYYPGSLFKILLTAAALEEGIVDLEQPFHCSGSYVFNEQLSISCWKEEGHGDIDFSEAFALSCNPSFIEVGLRLGRENLLKYVDKLHLIDPGITGYKNIYASHVSINPGKAALGNACLGQQGVKVSPVQLASLISTIADDGCWRPPSLLRYTINEKGQKHLPELENKKPLISSETARKMQRLMEKVVSEGTGKTAALSETRVAGKTATSQTGNLNEDGEEILNAWFGGFFPAENPRWAVVVMVEDGKSGSQDAAPVFRDIARSMLNCY